MKRTITVLLLAVLMTLTLSAAEYREGVTFKATEKTWSQFLKYTQTTTGKADTEAQEILRLGKESAFSTYTKVLTFYPDGSLLISNTAYTEIYVADYYVSESRVMIERSLCNAVFGTDYPITAGEDIDYIHFGYISSDGLSMSTNPNIIKNGNYFLLYR